MKHKTISPTEAELLSYFIRTDRYCFDYAEALEILGRPKKALTQLMSNMARKGLLMRLTKDIYYLIPYELEAEFFMPEWHLIPQYIVKDVEHYIGYYSALQIHNLTTQPLFKEQIVVSRKLRPSTITSKDIPFQFIYHNANHLPLFKPTDDC